MNVVMLFALLCVGFPIALLALMLGMERVEQPLRVESVGDRVAAALDMVRPDEVESLVTEGLSTPIARYWRRQARRPWVALLRTGTRA